MGYHLFGVICYFYWKSGYVSNATSMVGSIALAYWRNFPTTFCIYFLSSGGRICLFILLGVHLFLDP